ELPAEEALALMHERAATPRPLTGACWTAGALYLRLAGAASAVSHTAKLWGGERLAPQDADTFWQDLRELRLPALSTDKPLWRLSIKPTAPLAFTDADQVIDWCGAQRWVATDDNAEELYRYAEQAGGHAQLFRGGDRNAEVRSPLTSVQQRVQQSLKTKFDPGNILNPGRLYTWL
ncbi:MAG: glycolate oxidase subunit GlcE, partial [Halioglobus sp.]